MSVIDLAQHLTSSGNLTGPLTSPAAMTPVRSDPLPPESDSALVRLAQQDVRAFAGLYERYCDDILRYCYRSLGNRDDASDAAQQTFTNALAGLARFEDKDDSFRRWLYRIAHNEVINRRRQQMRCSIRTLTEADWVADAGASPEELAILADAHLRVHVLLDRLTPEQRRCCELRFSGLSHRETAAALGKSEVAVRASVRRGMAVLRDLVDDAP